MVAGRDRESLEAVARELGHDVLAVRADVTQLSEIDQLMAQAYETFGKLDILFVNALTGITNSSLYTANKGAVHALARALAAELIGRGIRVNTITIGPPATRLLTRSGSSQAILDAQDVARIGHSPVKRLGRPEEVARVALFLASDDSSFVVGAEIAADGGWLLNTI